MIKEVVEQILKENEKARDDDFVLTMNVLVKMGFAKRTPLGVFIEFKDIDNAPSFETITRIRREIQNQENRFKASEEVQEKREKHRQEIRDYFSTKNSSYGSYPSTFY